MTTAYSRIDRFLRQNLNDKDYPAYKDELDAICQAKLQRKFVGLTIEDCEEVERWVEFKEEGSGRIPIGKLARYIEAKLKELNT